MTHDRSTKEWIWVVVRLQKKRNGQGSSSPPRCHFTQKVFYSCTVSEISQEKINEIVERGNVPIICGGTGFYIQALVDSVCFPDVMPNQKFP